MNTIVINGTVSGIKYRPTSDGNDVEFICVVVNLDSDKDDEIVNKIPVLAKGYLATVCYSEICEGSYVEITGSLVRPDSKICYILAQNVLAKLPKKRRQFYMKKKEFLHIYKPNNIIESIVHRQIDGKETNEE